MDKLCLCNQSPRPQRRTNGLQFPLHAQQIIGWCVLILTAVINIVVLVPIQFHDLKIISGIIFIVLYILHVMFHLFALFLDPGEKRLRKSNRYNVPEFDRSVHAHVIENGRCHLCNIQTSSTKTKHCSICNKCVDRFDHHCKWLNNCIGKRNYKAFLLSVISAILLSIFTVMLCVSDIIFFFRYTHLLSPEAHKYISCASETGDSQQYCQNSIIFIFLISVFGIIAFAITCALLHLYCFHVYICILGMSTYEYITRSSDVYVNDENRKCCKVNINCVNSNNIKNNTSKEQNALDNKFQCTENNIVKTSRVDSHNNIHIAYLINTIVNEVSRAKKSMFYENNKVHPNNNDTS